MKLLQRANRAHLWVTTVLLVVAGIGLYVLITGSQRAEVSEKLLVNLDRVTDRLKQGGSIPQLPPVIEVVEVHGATLAPPVVKDTVLYDPQEGEEELFREATGMLMLHGTMLRISVRQVILEPHDFIGPIGLSLAGVFLALLVALQVINQRINRTLWRPFNHNLRALKRFNIREEVPLELRADRMVEFEEMNTVISEMAQRVRSDYRALKEFTANAAHEMQTPLASVLNNLELAMQSPALNEALAKDIGTAYGSAQRLSKLHQALLVLARIENRQFTANEPVDLRARVNEQLDHLAEMMAARSITVAPMPPGPPLMIDTDTAMLDLLLANLLGNAIKHNVHDGSIAIHLDGRTLVITNTGRPLDTAPEVLFDRFRKGDPASSSLGLGLAIARSICDSSGWSIAYTHEAGRHRIRIGF